MRLLLDTHVALWAITNHPSLSTRARSLISDTGNTVFASVASLWEIAIKHRLARGAADGIPMSSVEAFQYFLQAGYEILDVVPEHALAVETLPRLHGDPFDRILVAQAMTTPLRLLTRDAKVAAYSDSIIVV